jgi:hypothetical protein
MPVKDFKFVSPGVFIQEIDNSFRPAGSDAIAPVVVGRSTRGLAMQPVTVQSYSEFVEMFGDTVPGNGGGDIYRDGNYQSPMYGTYAAKAFLNANVAPLTYVRLLGQQTAQGSSDGGDAAAGWKTSNVALTNGASAGGAYGLFIAPSASNGEYTGSYAMQLAAVVYVQSGSVQLSGNLAGAAAEPVKASSTLINSDANGNFKLVINGAVNGEKVITVSMNEDSTTSYIRDALNTNPQLASAQGAFYPSSSYEDYWLGETFEQEMRDASLLSGRLVGVVAGLASGSASTTGPANMKSVASTEAVTGWFIGQDLGDAASYNPANAKKLFRLVGRGHGEWLHKHAKISIEDIRQSNTTVDPYGTFAVVVRSILDSDTSPVVLERFDNLNLNPASPNYVAKVIGDKFVSWDATNKELKTYGDYDNQSKYVRVEMNEDVDAGATEPALLPFGFYGPPKLKNVVELEANGSSAELNDRYVVLGTGLPGYTDTSGLTLDVSSSYGLAATASLSFPSARLKSNATNGGVSLAINGYFGVDTNRTTATVGGQAGIFDVHRLWNTSMVGTNGAANEPTSDNAMDDYSYIFTMDNVVYSGVNNWAYTSGSRTGNTSYTATSGTNALLDADINKFTAPLWGGFDGFDITKPDPMYNSGMSDSSTEDNSYIYHTYRRAIDTVSDPDFINMNLMAIPGLTQNSLTERMVRACEERADALALIDLPNVYVPTHEDYRAKSARVATTPTQAANALKLRRLDSSYGATYYPWVRTVDANTAQQVWVPPTVAMMGVLASSEASSAIWFAPAGFNRGGLSNGAAGIPIDGVTERVSSRDRDRLYEARINPIASFPSEGIVVFGQKTLQESDSALDRVNVRRLVIYLKKQISIISSNLLFEQNVQATWNRFKAQVRPLLANTRAGGGITDFRLYLDENTTTPDLIDQNIMYAKIMVKPARAIEYIAIDFVIASTGASFDD